MRVSAPSGRLVDRAPLAGLLLEVDRIDHGHVDFVTEVGAPLRLERWFLESCAIVRAAPNE